MSLLLSRGLFVRVTLETEIFQFPVRHLEPIMACHVFPRHRCTAAAAASAAAGLAFLHDHNSTALYNQRHALVKYSTPTKGGVLWAFRSQLQTKSMKQNFQHSWKRVFLLTLMKHNYFTNKLKPYAFEPSCVTKFAISFGLYIARQK